MVPVNNFIGIEIELKPALIRVKSNAALWYFLEGKDKEKLLALTQEIATRYHQKYGKTLKIKASSLLVEILVHVYCHNLGLKISSYLKNGLVKRFLEKLIERAKIVDCGESHRDSNRWVWDFLSYFKVLVVAVFPRKLSLDKLN